MSQRAWTVLLVLCAAFVALGASVNPPARAEQEALLESLATTASIVFGATGGWFALLYSSTPVDHRDKNWKRRVRHILASMLLSAAVICGTLMAMVCIPIVAHLPSSLLTPAAAALLRVGFAGCCLLVAVEAWSVAMSMLPAIYVLRSFRVEETTNERATSFHGSATSRTSIDPVSGTRSTSAPAAAATKG